MIDLYRLGKLPGNTRIADEHPRDCARRIQSALFDKFPNPNFIPYIELHEFEALVLVDVNKIAVAFPDGEATEGIRTLKLSIGDAEPELVDEGLDTAPSKRIISAIPLYKRVKAVAGPEIVEEIGLDKVRRACPHFNEWVTLLESL